MESSSCGCHTCGTPLEAEQRRRELENPQASFWRHKFRLPGTQWTLSGHSRALERSGFVLEEPKIYLDAGVGLRNATNGSCHAILITHTHIDHINALPLLARVGPTCDPAIVVPRAHVNNVREFTRLSWGIKGEDGSDRAGQRVDLALKPQAPHGVTLPVDQVGAWCMMWCSVMWREWVVGTTYDANCFNGQPTLSGGVEVD